MADNYGAAAGGADAGDGTQGGAASKKLLAAAAQDDPKFWLPKQLVNQLGYGGCAIIYTVFWYTRGRGSSDAEARRLLVLLIMFDAHFVKRCLECLFVHKWSQTKNELFMGLGEWLYVACGIGTACVHAAG